MSIKQNVFGKTKEGQEVTIYEMTNKNGMSVAAIDYGCNLVHIMVPDRQGKKADIVLGYDDIAGYEFNSCYLGSFIGRHANRIGGAQFELNGTTYKLSANDSANNLHSGEDGYNHKMFKTEAKEENGKDQIVFYRLSPDMEQGFPGNLQIWVSYTLTDENELIIDYKGIADQDTIVNLTNHSYFNLGGHSSGSIEHHKVRIMADAFTPTSDALIPTGEIRNVEGTPMDFREYKTIGQDINEEYEPLKLAGGYDHNYVLSVDGSEVTKVADLLEETSGRHMEVYTNKPGMQFYTGNFLKEEPGRTYKDGVIYQARDGVCFETQYYPDSCNINTFPSSVLKANEEYNYTTIYKFTCE